MNGFYVGKVGAPTGLGSLVPLELTLTITGGTEQLSGASGSGSLKGNYTFRGPRPFHGRTRAR